MRLPLEFNKLNSTRRCEYILRRKNIEEEFKGVGSSINIFTLFFGFIMIIVLLLFNSDNLALNETAISIIYFIPLIIKIFIIIFLIETMVNLYDLIRSKNAIKQLNEEFFVYKVEVNNEKQRK